MSEMAVKVQTGSETERRLFKEKNFVFLWLAGLFSSMSMSVFLFSQSWFVVQSLGLEASLGLIFIASTIPRLLFMAIGGVIADRISRTKIMFISDITRALLVGGLVLFLITDLINLWTLVFFALLFGVLDAFFWPASGSILPTLVKSKHLTRANSIIQMTNQMAMIFGPMIAGFVIVLIGFTGSFTLTSVLLLLASVFVAFIKLAGKTSSNHAEESAPSLLQQLKQGIVYVKTSDQLSALLITTAFLNLFIVGPLMMGLPLFVSNVLQGTTLDFSFLEGAFAAGMVAGSITIAVLNVNKKRGFIAMLSVLGMSVALLVLSQTFLLWQSMLAIFILGITFSFCNIPLISAIQDMCDKNMIGRVMSLLTMSSMGLTPVSFAITSLLLSIGVSIHYIMVTGAFLVMILVLFVFVKLPAVKTIH
ncbi:MFS transporter [Alteribacter keqinensis]|uniref:MFS transporter n=1 Tax=Alteribacter keqinensis TaxID=2483800 RepID=A0A3M7TWV5_9BACI|nr:MFS transporter [Alteribacter keqinensis]RNA69264.1 MFS transporter [Alteribacter keqinensis]